MLTTLSRITAFDSSQNCAALTPRTSFTSPSLLPPPRSFNVELNPSQMSSPKHLQLSDLPPEVLYLLLHLLPLSSLLSLSSTSSLFAALYNQASGSSSLWKSLYLDTFDDPRGSAWAAINGRLAPKTDGPLDASSSNNMIKIDWKQDLISSIVALRRARIQGGCCKRPPPLTTISTHYTPLLHLINTSPPEPLPSLNRLHLGSLDLSTFPVPPPSSPFETLQAYHRLRTLLLDSARYPLLHTKDRRAASRAAWTLVPPHGGLLSKEGEVNWEKLESVRRLLDRATEAGEALVGPVEGEAEPEKEVVDVKKDVEDWAGVEGEWKWVLRGVNAEAAETWRSHLQNPDSVPRPPWNEQVAAMENWTFGIKKLTLRRVLSSPDPTSSPLPSLRFEVVPSTSDHPFSSSHSSSHTSKIPVSTQGQATLTKGNEIFLTFNLQPADLTFEGVMLGGPGGVFYGTMSSTRRRGVGEITALFRMWK